MLEQFGVQRVLKPCDAARYGRVIDAKLLAGGRNCLVAAYSQEEAEIIPFKATITLSHNNLRLPACLRRIVHGPPITSLL
jgi:hypothetical protein